MLKGNDGKNVKITCCDRKNRYNYKQLKKTNSTVASQSQRIERKHGSFKNKWLLEVLHSWFFIDHPSWSNSIMWCVARCSCLLAVRPWSLSSGNMWQPLVQELCTTQTPQTHQIHQTRQSLEPKFVQISPTLRPLTEFAGGCRSSWKISWGPDKFIQIHSSSTNILRYYPLCTVVFQQPWASY